MPSFSAKLRRKQLDQRLQGIRLPELKQGYIREIRDSLEMSSYQLADRMGISQSTVRELETNERSGAITLRSLERAAEAMGCKLVYAMVPQTSLEAIVRQQAETKAAEIAGGVNRTMGLEHQSSRKEDYDLLLSELTNDILRKGGRELWR